MKYQLSNDVDIQKFKFRINQLIDSKSFVELIKISPKRSTNQNSYLHLIIAYFAVEYGETLEYIKKYFFKLKCNKDLFLTEYANKKTGEVRTDLKSTRDLTTSEMTTAIDRFRDYASKEAGIYLPSANEPDFLKHIEIEIERQKQYL